MNGRIVVPKSDLIRGIAWMGDRYSYPIEEIKGDTFPMTWADDDEIYTASGDPSFGPSPMGLDVQKFSGMPPNYTIKQMNPMVDYDGPGGNGPKPSGMICVDGILYLAFQNLLGAQTPPHSLLSQHGSDAQIVFATEKINFFIPSIKNIASPMFPGHKFGGPAFINFGKNNANARDSYVYAVSADQWDNGSNLRLGRVPNDRIMRREAWEYVCAFMPSGEPIWHSDLEEAIPILSLHRWISLPEMVYLAGINRYLLLTWHMHTDFSAEDGSDLIIFEAPEPWGPFSLVHLEENWEGDLTPYCPRLPLKWIDSDGISGWLQFSGCWSNRCFQSRYYRSHIRPFRLKMV